MAYDIPTMVSEATGVLKSLIAIPLLAVMKKKRLIIYRII